MKTSIAKSPEFGLRFQSWRCVYVILSVLLLLLPGCNSSELSRNRAETLIFETQDFKNVAAVDLISLELKNERKRGNISADSVDEPEKAAVEKRKAYYFAHYPVAGIANHVGLVNAQLTRRAERSGIWSGRPLGFWEFDENYSLTEKGKSLWADYNESPQETVVPTARKEFVEVTGITKQTPTDAVAEFTYRWLPNEFGRTLDPATDEFKNLPAELQKSLLEIKSPYGSTYQAGWGDLRKGMALFKRYDDGWRIVRISFL